LDSEHQDFRTSHFEGLGFKFRPTCLLTWLRCSRFSLVPAGKFQHITLK
jgi:hypothetical protein